MSNSKVSAFWNGELIAESENTVVVENNHYFPAADVKNEYLVSSEHTSVCGWKGTANYYHLSVKGSINENAVWYYATPKSAAENISGHMAFWKGVEIVVS